MEEKLVLKDTEVNQVISIPLVARVATARETKAKKPYLSLELFDGNETISGNYWDWSGVNIPQKNAILLVKAQVTEWQGTKQLNIKSLSTCTDYTLADFMPASEHDAKAIYVEAYAMLSDVVDNELRNIALSMFEHLLDQLLIAPGAKGVHHAYVAGTLIHSYSVAKIAKAIAEQTPGANVDLCVVGAMLHDIGKLYTYSIDGVSIDMTDIGCLYDHIYIGAKMLNDFVATETEKTEMLRHIILSHHGKLEHGAVVTPMSIEAHIVYHADSVDAIAEQVRACSAKAGDSKWTERIWTLENRPHLTTQYVAEVMKN